MTFDPKTFDITMCTTDPVGAYRLVFDERWAHGLDTRVPPYMQAGVCRYVLLGTRPGQFLQALFANDFMEMAKRADDINLASLGSYAMFLYNYAPQGCWGSAANREQWIEQRGYLLRQGDQ